LVSRCKAEASDDWGWLNGAVSETQLARHHARFQRREVGAPDLASASSKPEGSPDPGPRDSPAAPTFHDDGESAAIETAAPVAKSNSDIHIDPEYFAAELARIHEFNAWGLRRLAPYRPHIFYYEDLFEKSRGFHPRALHRLSEIAEVAIDDFAREPLTLKQAPDDFLEGVANRGQLIRRFRGTKYAWMFPFC
jgi:hypothetical protein